MFEIILLFIIVTIFILKPNFINFDLPKSNIKHFCDNFVGTWNGESCICKYPSFLTNNHYNGNCDKIVDTNCKRILTSNGKLFNFKTHNPYTEGVCDCKDDYYYDIITHKCILSKLNTLISSFSKPNKCEDGYYYNVKYHTCLKKLCSWDILFPLERVDQVSISKTTCKCSFKDGFIPISLANGTVGCTKLLKNRSWSKNHIILLEKVKEKKKDDKDWKTYHLYPLAALKSYLGNFYNIEGDNGTTMFAVEQIHGNWINDLLSKGVTINSQEDYTKYDSVLGFYDSSSNQLTIKIKNE